MLRIKAVTPLEDYWVRLTLTDGDVIERGLRDAMWGPVFEPLRRDYERFRRVRVAWGTLAWGRDLDLDPETLIWGGPAPGDSSVRPVKRMRLPRRPGSRPAIALANDE